VYGRWVLMYLPERAVEPLIGRVARWLRPSGVCALAELCNYRHIQIHPPSAHLPAIAEALMRAVAGDRGCNPETGNQWLWPDVLFRDHLPALVGEGHLPRETLDAFLAEWNERSRDPDAVFFGSPLMEVVGRRP
jgi:hypothetical protein